MRCGSTGESVIIGAGDVQWMNGAEETRGRVNGGIKQRLRREQRMPGGCLMGEGEGWQCLQRWEENATTNWD